MSDAAHSRYQLFDAYSTSSAKQKLTTVAMAVAFCVLVIWGTNRYFYAHLSMPADEFHRLDAAISVLANAKQKDANQVWQEVYLRLKISSVSELKKTHIDSVNRFIVDEIARGDRHQ